MSTLEYPPGFPEHRQKTVGAAIATAELSWLKASRRLPSGSRGDDMLYDLASRYIQTVCVAFLHQAREAVRAGEWSEENMRRRVNEFLLSLAWVVYYEKVHEHLFRLPWEPARDQREQFQRRVTAAIHGSAAWRKHLKECRAMFEVAVARRPPTLGETIDRYRCESGWTYEQLAERVGSSKDSVIDHVKHGVSPRRATLAAYA